MGVAEAVPMTTEPSRTARCALISGDTEHDKKVMARVKVTDGRSRATSLLQKSNPQVSRYTIHSYLLTWQRSAASFQISDVTFSTTQIFQKVSF